MKLREWVASQPGAKKDAVLHLADACEVTPSAVRHWLAGLREINFKYFRAIESATGGAVTCYDLCSEALGSAPGGAPPSSDEPDPDAERIVPVEEA